MSLQIVIRSLVSVIVLPGVAAVLIPWLILGPASGPDGAAWVGLLPLGFGLVIFIWCVLEFATRVWHLFVILWEEPSLERTFGDEYRSYRESVPRWLPRMP